MQLLGAKVHAVSSGSRTLKDAMNEAMRDWVTNVATTYYCVGSVAGPHPYPSIVRDFQRVIGDEAKRADPRRDGQAARRGGRLRRRRLERDRRCSPRSSTTPSVELFGVEAAGDGVETGSHAATLSAGRLGVLHGMKSYVLQDADGQVIETHSISAGLDYPGVGPEHAFLKDSGRAGTSRVTDDEALEGFQLLARTEGIIPALESSHAIAYLPELGKRLGPDNDVVVCLVGRGDKDLETITRVLSGARERTG